MFSSLFLIHLFSDCQGPFQAATDGRASQNSEAPIQFRPLGPARNGGAEGKEKTLPAPAGARGQAVDKVAI